MKLEVVFSYTRRSRDRYENEKTNTVSVLYMSSQPSDWPYLIKTEWKSERGNIWFGDYEVTDEGEETTKIPQHVFEGVKAIVARHSQLQYCKDNIDNPIMDGGSEDFQFSCDTFTKNIGGLEVLLCATYDENKPASQRSDNYYVSKAFNEIQTYLESQGFFVL